MNSLIWHQLFYTWTWMTDIYPSYQSREPRREKFLSLSRLLECRERRVSLLGSLRMNSTSAAWTDVSLQRETALIGVHSRISLLVLFTLWRVALCLCQLLLWHFFFSKQSVFTSLACEFERCGCSQPTPSVFSAETELRVCGHTVMINQK